MTLAQIMTLALRQLDEDLPDIAQYADLFRVYANEGYQIAVRTYLKPKATTTLHTDSEGSAYIGGMRLGRIVQIFDMESRPVWFALSLDGEAVSTLLHGADLTVIHEPPAPMLETDQDIPQLPDDVHHALADSICYRHLANGNMAKQSRAQHYLAAFHQAMRSVTPQGAGSVTRMKNLYEATDIRRR